MNASWMKETFGNEKPIVAMCHLRAMKGDPNFDTDLSEGSMEKVVELARRDLIALQNGGVDAVMFSNEFSLLLRVGLYCLHVIILGVEYFIAFLFVLVDTNH